MIKKNLTAVAVFTFGFANAQDARYGVKAGADFASIKFKYLNVSGSETNTGFYMGGFADAEIS